MSALRYAGGEPVALGDRVAFRRDGAPVTGRVTALHGRIGLISVEYVAARRSRSGEPWCESATARVDPCAIDFVEKVAG